MYLVPNFPFRVISPCKPFAMVCPLEMLFRVCVFVVAVASISSTTGVLLFCFSSDPPPPFSYKVPGQVQTFHPVIGPYAKMAIGYWPPPENGTLFGIIAMETRT